MNFGRDKCHFVTRQLTTGYPGYPGYPPYYYGYYDPYRAGYHHYPPVDNSAPTYIEVINKLVVLLSAYNVTDFSELKTVDKVKRYET